MDKVKQWVCFFSQTGSEINAIRKALGRDPDIIVTNKQTFENVDPELMKDFGDKFFILSNRPTQEEYERLETLLNPDCLITLHGFLRIVPGWFCDKYYILNGHPGDVSLDNGILKGHNPQEKAFNLGLEYTGSTIHRCTAELDSGAVVDIQPVCIKGLTLDEVYRVVHANSVSQWIKILGDKFNN